MKTLLICATLAVLASACTLGPAGVDGTSTTAATGCQAPRLPDTPALASAPDAPLLARVWVCRDRRMLTTYPRGPDIDLLTGDCQMPLKRTPSDNGQLYDGSAAAFWIRGSTADYISKTGSVLNCQEVPLMSRLQDARIRGVTWSGRAVDGSWTLDIGPDDRIVVTSHNGDRRVFRNAARVINPRMDTTVHTAREGAAQLSATVTVAKCRDAAGNAFPGKVSLVLEGKSHDGCGLPLSR